MDTVGKLIAAALLCSVICLLLKKQAPELTLCLCVLVCALCFLTAFPFFSPILAFFHRLEELTGLSGAALAQAVEICCGFISFYLALPLLEMVLSLLQTMIGG